MKTHQFKTNQLGYTYNQFGENLLKQLNISYQKLHGQDSKTTMGAKPKSHRKDDLGI
jgi:hypothetical protein